MEYQCNNCFDINKKLLKSNFIGLWGDFFTTRCEHILSASDQINQAAYKS